MTTATADAWKSEQVLIADLAAVNTQIGIYVLRALAADADRDEPTSPAEEHRLGSRLVDLGTTLQTRATHRAISTRDAAASSTSETATRNRSRPQLPTWTNDRSAIYAP